MLPRSAQAYIGVVIAMGSLSVFLSLYHLRLSGTAAFAILALLAVIGGALKIRVPGVDGNVSLSFLPFSIAAVFLSLPETVLLTASATVVQARAFSKRRFQPLQVAFNCSALVLSVVAAASVGSLLGQDGGSAVLVRLALAALVYYTCNSILVATVIGLAEGRPVRTVWNNCLRRYLPYLFAGLFCLALAFSGPQAELLPGVSVLPLMLLVRHYFKSDDDGSVSGDRRAATGPS
jgi:hypothetical protein